MLAWSQRFGKDKISDLTHGLATGQSYQLACAGAQKSRKGLGEMLLTTLGERLSVEDPNLVVRVYCDEATLLIMR